jgi:hypothetical protein
MGNIPLNFSVYVMVRVTRNWLKQYATSRMVAGSISDEVIGFNSIDEILPAGVRLSLKEK